MATPTPGHFGGGSTGPDQVFLGIMRDEGATAQVHRGEGAPRAPRGETRTPRPQSTRGTAFEQFKPEYLLWGPLRPSFASASTPAGCLLQLIHGLDEGARGAESQRKKNLSKGPLTL
jgi:hypothetical protein